MRSITVVGGGVVGTSLAYHLGETSHDVTLLEKRGLGAGTTGKSIACFGWYPFYAGREFELASRSWTIYEPLVEAGTLSYHETGLLEPVTTEAAFEQLRESVEALRANGIPAELLDPEAVREHGVSPDVASAGAAFFPSVGRLDPAEIVAAFADRARDRGVAVETGVEVTNVRTDDGAVTGLETIDGDREADVVVNAAGPWAPRLDAMAGLSFPLRHTLAPICVLETAENVELPTVILEDGFYLTGERSATVLAGHAPQESGVEDGWEAAIEIDDPDAHQGVGSGTAGERHRERVAEAAPRVVPALDGADLSNEWLGLRCVTPDERPLVGPTAVDGYYVATGMSGWGITLGPACGQLLAEHLSTGAAGDELASLSPDRFAGTEYRS